MRKYFMPAEWQLHKQCWMLWPNVDEGIWRKEAVPAKHAFANVARSISCFENVIIGAHKDFVEEAKSYFQPTDGGTSNIRVVEMNYYSSWMRDVGPTFVLENNDGSSLNDFRVLPVNWKFNGWGQKVPDNAFDDTVANQVAAYCLPEIGPTIHKDFVLEGGSIHVDGEGTVLTTEECLLHQNRNPSLTKSDIEGRLLESLGAEKVIWLPRGLYADEDTNGHIDNFCCFSRPGEVILAWCDDPTDEQYHISREAFEILSNTLDAKGRRLSIVKLHIPSPMYYTADDLESLPSSSTEVQPMRTVGQRLAGSYVNFYIANGGIVCPSFSQPTADEMARTVLQNVFPQRKVVMVPNGKDILLGGGNIHCITQQQPEFYRQSLL